MSASHPTTHAPPAAAANTEREHTQPTCQNCSTSTTPLWRRDEMGSVLCNACGLFLKLHGRPRPISLKTDVIKSRNRVKTMRPDMQMKKKQSLPATTTTDHHGLNLQNHDSAVSAALAAVRRATQQKSTNGNGAADSPVSRTGTPNMYDPQLAAFHQDMSQFPADGLPQYPLPAGGSRPTSPLNGDQQNIDAPQTHEQLMAANSSLKTRVSELDLINELYRGRLTQLESEHATADNYRHNADVATKEAATERMQREEIQRQLEESHRRENMLKRRLDELEQENQDLKAKFEEEESGRHAKKQKIEKEPVINDPIVEPITEPASNEPAAEPSASNAAPSATEPAAESPNEAAIEPTTEAASETNAEANMEVDKAEVAPEDTAAEKPRSPSVS